jgi:hypothetical protein
MSKVRDSRQRNDTPDPLLPFGLARQMSATQRLLSVTVAAAIHRFGHIPVIQRALGESAQPPPSSIRHWTPLRLAPSSR